MPETRNPTPNSPRGFAHNLLAVLVACVSFSIGAAGATGVSSVLRDLQADGRILVSGNVLTNAELETRRDALAGLAR